MWMGGGSGGGNNICRVSGGRVGKGGAINNLLVRLHQQYEQTKDTIDEIFCATSYSSSVESAKTPPISIPSRAAWSTLGSA